MFAAWHIYTAKSIKRKIKVCIVVLVLAGVELIFSKSGYCKVVVWICAEHRVDKREMFLLLLIRAYTEPRPFLLFVLPHR